MKRLTTTQTAKELGVSPTMVREYARSRILSAITTSGEIGVGQRMYFDADEVEALKSGGAPAAAAYRERQAGVNIVDRKPRRRQKV